MHIIISIRGWIYPPDTDMVNLTKNGADFCLFFYNIVWVVVGGMLLEHNSESVAGTDQRVDSVGLRAALAVFGFVLVDIVGDGDFCDGIGGECYLAHGVPPVAVRVVIRAVGY